MRTILERSFRLKVILISTQAFKIDTILRNYTRACLLFLIAKIMSKFTKTLSHHWVSFQSGGEDSRNFVNLNGSLRSFRSDIVKSAFYRTNYFLRFRHNDRVCPSTFHRELCNRFTVNLHQPLKSFQRRLLSSSFLVSSKQQKSTISSRCKKAQI